MKKKSFLKNLWSGISGKTSSLFYNPYKVAGIGWFKLKYYKHLPPGKLRKHKLNGHYIYFKNPQEFLHGIREIFIEKIYNQEISDPPLVLDCGANIGLSVIYLKTKYPDSVIHAFEPDDANFELLSRNIKSYNFQDVHLYKEAIWKENTEIFFADEGSMSSHIQKNILTGKKVKAIRLKDTLTQKVDFLKMDIEGAEYDVIIDIADKLPLIENLFIEYHGRFDQHAELSKIFQTLSENSFHFYIKEATSIYEQPFTKRKNPAVPFDVQLNIFCMKDGTNSSFQ